MSLNKDECFFPVNDILNKLLCEEGKPKIKKYKDTKQKNETCPITLNKLLQETEVAELLCGHCFESNALKEWLNKRRKSMSLMSCPLCRDELKIDSKKTIEEFVKKLVLEEEKQLQKKICTSFFEKQ